jgi:hypothetical protein
MLYFILGLHCTHLHLVLNKHLDLGKQASSSPSVVRVLLCVGFLPGGRSKH